MCSNGPGLNPEGTVDWGYGPDDRDRRKTTFPAAMRHSARELIGGVARGELLYATVGLSFWGGVDPLLGSVIDHTHPLHQQCISGKILAIPNGRGSCTGSQVILELLLNDKAPAAILLRQPDAILCLGVIVAEELFGKSIPVVSLGNAGFEALAGASHAAVQGSTVYCSSDSVELDEASSKHSSADELLAASGLQLTVDERSMLEGDRGEARRVAMRILSRAAAVQGAPHLIEITQAHIDGCTYIGPGGLRFAQTLVKLGGKVAVPTTLNSISIDRQRWRMLGVSAALGDPSGALGDAYLALGAKPSYTCAPYLLDSAPALGEQIAWGESNAVAFANSVLGARTQKYADYLDICAAIVARAPAAGAHLDAERVATVVVDARSLVQSHADVCADAFYPVLGYLCGSKAEARVPVVLGLAGGAAAPTRDDLKAFSAAFATTSAAPMFHMVGVTPEAPSLAAALGPHAPPVETIELTPADLAAAWRALDSAGGLADDPKIELVALGNPHLSLTECARLAQLCSGAEGEPAGTKHRDVSMVVTMGREVYRAAEAAGHTKVLERFGVQFVTDTCWCMLTEPVVPVASRTIMTNSGKYAHYAPGLVNRRIRFDSMASCVAAARSGHAPPPPRWLADSAARSRGFATATFAATVRRVCTRALMRR